MQNDTTFFHLIRRENNRQSAKGYTAAHDDEHVHGELAAGASCYLLAGAMQQSGASAEKVQAAASKAWIFSDPETFRIEADAADNILKGLAMGIAELKRLGRAGKIPGGECAAGELELFDRLVDRVRHARAKHPHRGNMLFGALVAEQGELAMAIMNETPERIIDEALDVAAVAIRIASEGDETVEQPRLAKGLDAWPR